MILYLASHTLQFLPACLKLCIYILCRNNWAECPDNAYLPEVPRTGADLFLCAVVNPPGVIQHVLVPLFLVIQEHCVLCKNTTCMTSMHDHLSLKYNSDNAAFGV